MKFVEELRERGEYGAALIIQEYHEALTKTSIANISTSYQLRVVREALEKHRDLLS